ncbi:MAG: glycosyl transferase [Betaproteobacteria bacterium]|nr:glycosyl transferase [Betaproteobacteria bacterium]
MVTKVVEKERCAPIALFVYNRPAHTRRTVESLLANSQAAASALFVFCDGAKSPGLADAVETTRAYVRGLAGFASLTVIERDRNLGLAQSITQGVGQLCAEHGRVIVLEDDLVLSPYFLRYMNQGLDRYADEPAVASIHGYTYPVDAVLPETFFIRGADCWGWATWARAWKFFEPDAVKLREQLRASGELADFDFDGTAGYVRMLNGFIAGKNDSWAIRWHAAAYLRNMLTLYPGRSLVRNIGVDGSGTHSGDVDLFANQLAVAPIAVESIELRESPVARAAFGRYFRFLNPTLTERVRRRIRRILNRPAATK